MVCERQETFNPLEKLLQTIIKGCGCVTAIPMSYLCLAETENDWEVVRFFGSRPPTFAINDLFWVGEGTTAEQLPRGFYKTSSGLINADNRTWRLENYILGIGPEEDFLGP